MSRTRKESGEGTVWLTDDQEFRDAILTVQTMVRELSCYLDKLESKGARRIVSHVINMLLREIAEHK